jgi:hypothetical protein
MKGGYGNKPPVNGVKINLRALLIPKNQNKKGKSL